MHQHALFHSRRILFDMTLCVLLRDGTLCMRRSVYISFLNTVIVYNDILGTDIEMYIPDQRPVSQRHHTDLHTPTTSIICSNS